MADKTPKEWEEIILTKAKNGGFWCSWRYRDFFLDQICHRLLKKGLIKKDWKQYKAGGDVYVLKNNK